MVAAEARTLVVSLTSVQSVSLTAPTALARAVEAGSLASPPGRVIILPNL